MSELDEFLKNQEGIYSRFRVSADEVNRNGVKPYSGISQHQGGYIIALRHPYRIAEGVEEFAQRIAAVAPVLPYDSRGVHTSIAVYGVQNGFTPDSLILEKLSSALHKARKHLAIPPIDYREWLYNQDSVIVGGIPNEVFVYMAKAVVDACRSEGVEVRPPWGAHITAARYTQEKRSAELNGFFELMGQAPVLGLSEPYAIDVGCFTFGPDGFKLETSDRFALFRQSS